MIYRHYKGGLYFSIGFATRFSKDFPATSIEQVGIARYTEAQTEEEKKPITVLSVLDKRTGSVYYSYDSNEIDGVHIFYKDLDGNLWLRPLEMFTGYLKDGRKRFVKVKGEELFDLISKLLKEVK